MAIEIEHGIPALVRTAPPRDRAGTASLLSGLAVLGVLVVLPFLVKNFIVFQMTMVLVYAIAILGLNLLTGISGQFSLGHGAFYALGAYTAAIMIEHAGIGYAWTIPGRRPRVLRRRVPVRIAGPAPGRRVSGARHLRAGRGHAAVPEAFAAGALDRRRAAS